MSYKQHSHRHEREGTDPFKSKRTLIVVLDGVGAELSPGIKVDAAIHFACDIGAWRLLALEAGDLQVDIWKTTYAGFPPTVTDTITGSDVPILSTADKAESAALTGWTTTVAAGDTFRFNIDSVSGITRATLTLYLIR